jgi:hypothetical protein
VEVAVSDEGIAKGPLYATAREVATSYGGTSRHWSKLATAGEIPGAHRPNDSPRGHWLFHRQIFNRWAKSVKLNPIVAEPLKRRAFKSKPKREDHVIYAIYSAGHIKFGVSSNIHRRSDSFRTASPLPIALIATITGSYDLEYKLQQRFSFDRAAGEWFRLSAAVREFIDEMRTTGTAYDLIDKAEADFHAWAREILR